MQDLYHQQWYIEALMLRAGFGISYNSGKEPKAMKLATIQASIATAVTILAEVPRDSKTP